jgi:hypothetical protein
VREAAINLHHLGEQIECHLSDRTADLPKLSLFHRTELLGAVGAPADEGRFPARKEPLVLSSDAIAAPDFAPLSARRCESVRLATLRMLESRESARQTPLQAEGNRIASFRRQADRPFLERRAVAVSPRLPLGKLPGEGSPVEELMEPLLGERREEVGRVRCDGARAGLGRPGDFVRSTLEALDRGGLFP